MAHFADNTCGKYGSLGTKLVWIIDYCSTTDPIGLRTLLANLAISQKNLGCFDVAERNYLRALQLNSENASGSLAKLQKELAEWIGTGGRTPRMDEPMIPPSDNNT